jgi:hypothetical protein
MTGGSLADIEAEAERVLQLAGQAGAMVRLLGGLGVARHRHRGLPGSLQRTYGDIDLVVKHGQDRALRRALDAMGYVPDRAFNNLRGDRRLLYYDESRRRQLDVFVGEFRMCHELELDGRLDLDPATLAPADLLLTKLQIVEVNEKDLVDALALVLCHDLGVERSGDVIGTDRLAQVTSRDWGWYTTFTDNLIKLRTAADDLLSGIELDLSHAKIDALAASLADAPKSIGWKARAMVGRRLSWYELPEEVATKRHG